MMVMFMVFATRYKKVPPNKAMVVFGHRFQGNKGMMIYTGGGRFIQPIIESVGWLDLETRPLNIEVRGVKTKDDIMVDVEIAAQIQIDSQEDSLKTAAVMLLNKTSEEIDYVAMKTIEGHVRGVCIALAHNQINAERAFVSEQIRHVVAEDLKSMGLNVVSLTLSDVKDHVPQDPNSEMETVGMIRDPTYESLQISKNIGTKASRKEISVDYRNQFLMEQERLAKLWETYAIQEKRLKEANDKIEELEMELEFLRDTYGVRE